ncbi:AraC family transcriptional regulator [Paenibacillus eucommiae]|uniref:AraC-like DNA-binding protein/quercetin dioxygenase-like cupin family protein n=1 Tax=Paenibacillus eucommiae TaxID=1355755 RepID=A0ABS4IM14_9BACL|nr:AraC family transcriptional regulator [Paenibacillus eucommiae]MBP1988543.1 AraC-like DNA-binding protein/quercetin dioxygenase-like cupin family protein [Paenibacillus eucommiae]
MHVEFHFSDMTHTLQIAGCHFGVKPAGWLYPRHHHHLFEILYCWEGTFTQIVDEQKIKVRTGELVLIKPGIKHLSHNDSSEPHAYFNIHFNIDDLELRNLLTNSSYQHMDYEGVRQTRLPAYLKELEGLLQQGLIDPGNRQWINDYQFIHLKKMEKLFLQGHILLIIQEVVSFLTSRAEEDEAASLFGSTLQIDIAHAIESRLQSTVCAKGAIAQIAKEQSLSRSHCHKIFTKVYGRSPRQYLSQLKLNQAKQLLLSSELTVDAISRELGFASSSHFSRQFRRWAGISPNQFRPKP